MKYLGLVWKVVQKVSFQSIQNSSSIDVLNILTDHFVGDKVMLF